MLRPDLADAYLNRGLARQGLRQYQAAERDLTAALERGGATRLYFLRGRVREKLGNKEGAQADFAEAMCRPPQDEKSWIAHGIHLLGSDPSAALADFEKALRLNPRSADALQNKAHVLAEKLREYPTVVALDVEAYFEIFDGDFSLIFGHRFLRPTATSLAGFLRGRSPGFRWQPRFQVPQSIHHCSTPRQRFQSLGTRTSGQLAWIGSDFSGVAIGSPCLS